MQSRTNTKEVNLVGALYTRYASTLQSYFGAYARDAMAAEDMTHDLFLRLLAIEHLDTTTAKALIFTIARRIIIDDARRRSHALSFKRHYYEKLLRRQFIADCGIELLNHYESDGLETMTKRRAQVYLMYFREGKSCEEISQTLHITKRTVESHIYASRQIMCRHLQGVV